MTIDQPSHPVPRLSALTWLLLLGAMGSLVVGLVVPGTSYVLLCVSIALSGAALLSRAAGRRREDGETDGDRSLRPGATGAPHAPVLEEDERWNRVLAASQGTGEERRPAGGETTPAKTPGELRDVVSELAAQVRAELEAVRSELRQREMDRDDAVLQRIEELASTSRRVPEGLEASLTAVREAVDDLRDGLASGSGRDVDDRVPSTAAYEQLEAAISDLTAVAGSVGTLAEVEVVVETSMRDLRSAISSLSERVEGIPVALRAEVDESLARVETGVSHLRESVEPKVEHLLVQAERRPVVDEDLVAQLSELRRGVDALATLGGSTRELRTAVASVSEDVRSLDAAVQASSQRQASLAEEMMTLKDEVTRLAKRVPARADAVRLKDDQIEALAEAVAAAAPRPRTTKKAPSAAPTAATPAARAAGEKAKTTRAKKAVATKTVSPSKTARTPRAGTETARSARNPVKATATKAGVKQAANARKRSSPAPRASSRPRKAAGTSTEASGAAPG